MHQLIHGLVYADSSEEALETARHDVFEPLVRRSVYDYVVTFDQDGRGVSGADRWGSLPPAVSVETDRGEELVDRGWEATTDSYQRSFDRVEEFLSTHDPQNFWEEQEIHMEYALDFQRIGQFEGPATFLYDQDGVGIRNRGHLESVRNYWTDLGDSEPYENLELYVVPADVHY